MMTRYIITAVLCAAAGVTLSACQSVADYWTFDSLENTKPVKSSPPPAPPPRVVTPPPPVVKTEEPAPVSAPEAAPKPAPEPEVEPGPERGRFWIQSSDPRMTKGYMLVDLLNAKGFNETVLAILVKRNEYDHQQVQDVLGKLSELLDFEQQINVLIADHAAIDQFIQILRAVE